MEQRALVCCGDDDTTEIHMPVSTTKFRMAAVAGIAAAAIVCVSCIVVTKRPSETSIGDGGSLLLGAYEEGGSRAELAFLWDTLEVLKNNTRDLKEQVHAMRHDYQVCGAVVCRGSEKCCSGLCCGAEASCCGGICCSPGSKCCKHPVLNTSICGTHDAECRDGFVFAPTSPVSNPETWIPRGRSPERFGASALDLAELQFKKMRTLTDRDDGEPIDALGKRGMASFRPKKLQHSKHSDPSETPATVAEPAARTKDAPLFTLPRLRTLTNEGDGVASDALGMRGMASSSPKLQTSKHSEPAATSKSAAAAEPAARTNSAAPLRTLSFPLLLSRGQAIPLASTPTMPAQLAARTGAAPLRTLAFPLESRGQTVPLTN